jgi:hypothetical protein
MSQLELLRILDAPGRAPAGLAWDGQSLWLNDYQDGLLYRFDVDSGKPLNSLLCAGVISGLTWDGESLWQTRLDENWLQRLNVEGLDIDQTLPVESYERLSDAAWDGSRLRVISQSTGRLLTLNPDDGRIEDSMPIPQAATAVTYHEGSLWLAYPHQMVFRPETGSFEWLNKEQHYYLLELDPTSGSELARYELDFLPMGLTWKDLSLWLSQPAAALLHEFILA